MRVSLVFLLVALPAVAADRDEREKAELKRLEGAWLHVSTEREGVTKPEPRTIWVFEENRAKFYYRSRPAKQDPKTWRFELNESNHEVTYHFKLDPTQTPKTLDQRTEYRGRKELTKASRAIYKLEGDTLTICYEGYYDRGKRPEEFSAAKGSDRTLYILKREKK